MATFTVTNLNDSGPGSLRAAIDGVNAQAPGVSNAITFAVSGTITLASDLPSIARMVEIVAGNTDTGNPPTVGINFNQNAGLVFGAGSAGSQLVGLAVGNADGHGVTLNAGNILLNNNYIGLALSGSALGNSGDGVFVATTSSGNQIGSNPEAAILSSATLAATGVISNVISANGGNGISFHASADNIVVSNRIGTSTDGNTALANGANGIWLTDGSSDNTIGGTVIGYDSSNEQNNPTGDKGTGTIVVVLPPLGNQVSGNAANGILIDASSENNFLNGNLVGTTASGNSALGNQGDGVAIIGADGNSLIGCTVVDEPFVYYNVVGGNGGNGIRVTDSDNVTIRANFVGLGANNDTLVGNALDGVLINGSSFNTQVGGVIPLGNVISGNTLNGIEVAGTASGFSTLNTFAGTTAFFGTAPNGNNGILITSTGGNQTVQTNVISGNANNGLEISGDAWGVSVVPNIIGLDTRGDLNPESFANGNNGILITGNAHDNFVGGTQVVNNLSVIRQNTISGNSNYGIEIAGNAHHNVVANGAIGTNIQETQAIANGAGGVLLSSSGIGNVVGTAITGWAPLPSAAAAVNVISGNSGPGVSLTTGVNFNAVINNWIGQNILGQSVLPNTVAIDDDGGINLIYGNAPSGPLPVELPTGQLEALYVGWFGRAGDPQGFQQNMESFLTQILNGASLATAALEISQGFATSPENAAYASLAALQTPVPTPTPQQTALADSFVNQTYGNLFGRAATLAELSLWSSQFFDGTVAFSALVYDIASFATADADILAMNSKIQAASYFTTAAAESVQPLSLAAMRAAVSGVTNPTTELASEAATDLLVGSTHTQIDYQTILPPTDITTGVRADLDGAVILTGSQVIPGTPDTQAYLYQGPLNNTPAGTVHLLDPTFGGQNVTTSTFYGPDTAIFTPGIGLGNVRAVGSYQYQESPQGVFNHGMMYQGPVDGVGGIWTQIDVPSNGVNVVDGVIIGTTVENTILHSTQGDLVVGNYDLVGLGGTALRANGFIYNIATQQYTLMAIDGSYDNLTTLYGIWQNGVGSTSYTLAGGTRDGTGVNVGFLQLYDSSTGVFSDLTFYTAHNIPGVITHFENITAVPGGFNLVATTDSGPAFVFIAINPDGSFGDAVWTSAELPGSNLMTGNIVHQNIFGGIYNTDDESDAATYLGVVDQSHVDAAGGLIMPVASLEFAYGLTVFASIGATIVGSAVAGNVLGGSIGNDIFTGTQSLEYADTIYTGGGADRITLAAGNTARDRIELFAGNSLASASDLSAGAPVSSVAGSIVSANDIPQLGWWGQATGQLGGPVSSALTNAGIGTGTSQDLSTVVNFTTGTGSAPLDMVDFSLDAFSDLVRTASGTTPTPGAAVFSNAVGPGGTITVANASVIVIDSALSFANAAQLAAALEANPITFAAAQTAAFNHYLIAYQDLGGDVRLADMDIQRGNAASFLTTAGGATLSISDMVELEGVSLASLRPGNINLLNGTAIANSSYLDFTGYGVTDATTVAAAYGLAASDIEVATTAGLNVAIILDRVEDPTTLLSSSWGTRQQTLAQLNGNDTLWSTYGADEAQYNTVVSELQGTYGLTVLDGTNSATKGDYVSSADSRTIWVELNTAAEFNSLFGTTLFASTAPDDSFVFWNGNLALPSEWNVKGLWFDTDNSPPPSNLAPAGASVTLPQGPQGIGNTTASTPNMAPQDIAALYDFPLQGLPIDMGFLALVEPAIGSAVPSDGGGTFRHRLDQYLTTIGQPASVDVFVQGQNGQTHVGTDTSERSQDVGTAAGINPNSTLGLYTGSGVNGNAESSIFTALQSAIWDTTNDPNVISNSFYDFQSMTPGSPFYEAYRQLFVDAALRNQTAFSIAGDGGSGNEVGNGLTNVIASLASPYGIAVGGTSLSTLSTAERDPTLISSIVQPALSGNLATIWQLVGGGLTRLPINAATLQTFVETTWNAYFVDGTTITTSDDFFGGYLQNTTTSGGVDATQPTPSYQLAYGLTPTTSDPSASTGRGGPDVAANAGGNLQYLVPFGDMLGTTGQIGTSSATPLWASLGLQLNAIFNDQGLPPLGYMNDLLYTASAIAPASFNDVTLGGNMSSFVMGGPYLTLNGDGTGLVNVTPTGYGYFAGPGYDLVTGLGSPDGLLLARALTAIGHSQTYFSSNPDMLDADGDGWTSGTNQTLLFQTMSGSGATVDVDLGSDSFIFSSAASGAYAWTNQFAQQSLQADFDPALVRMFDKYAQGAVMQSAVSSGDDVGVTINSSAADAIQGGLSSPFGFADFVTNAGAVRVARPVAVAETAGGLDDQVAVVRLRQNGEDSLSLSFYEVDTLSGAIGTLQPGDPGYAAAAQARAYQVVGGGTSINGPGYGNYTQAMLVDIDANDLIAMKLTNNTSQNTFWAFAQANETVAGQQVGHLWSYGLNTWGWEDLYGGGDRDFNDLLAQLDFTSATNSGWLV